MDRHFRYCSWAKLSQSVLTWATFDLLEHSCCCCFAIYLNCLQMQCSSFLRSCVDQDWSPGSALWATRALKPCQRSSQLFSPRQSTCPRLRAPPALELYLLGPSIWLLDSFSPPLPPFRGPWSRPCPARWPWSWLPRHLLARHVLLHVQSDDLLLHEPKVGYWKIISLRDPGRILMILHRILHIFQIPTGLHKYLQFLPTVLLLLLLVRS